MFIECSQMFINIGIRKTRNNYDFLFLFWFRYETFIYLFELKVFRHEERETQFLSMLTFPSDPRCKLLVWPRRAPKIDLLRPSPNLNSVFFQIPKSSAHRFRAWRHSRTRFFLLWHLWLSHPPRARVNSCTQCVHLTNPCTKPKGFQLN